MKILLSLLLFTFCTAVLSQTTTTDANDSTVDTSTVTTISTTEETTVPSSTDSTTPTLPETTSTTVSSTTKQPVTSTTKQPVTSTTKQPVTTSIPSTTAFPDPEPCKWNVTQNNVTCIRAELQAQFIIPVEGGKDLKINLGCEAKSLASDCSSNDTQTLNLIESNSYNFTMVFEKDGENFFARNITFDYTLSGGESGSVESSKKLFIVKIGNSYLCKSKSTVHLQNVTMEISEIHIQAFGAKDNEDYGSAQECEADDKVSDVVPIAVGVALAALIIIVLIAYLVGRRRSRQKGYQSV